MGRPPPGNEDRQAVDDKDNVRLGEGPEGERWEHQFPVHGCLEFEARAGRALAADAKNALEGRNVGDQPVRPRRQDCQEQGRRQPCFDRLEESPVGAAVGRVVKQKGPVNPAGNKPAGAQRDAGRSFRAEEGSPVVQKGLPGGDLQCVVDGRISKGNVGVGCQIDPDRVLHVDNVVHRIELLDGVRDGHLGVVEESLDDRVVDGVGRKGIQEQNSNVTGHDELVFRRRGKFEEAVLEFFGKLPIAVAGIAIGIAIVIVVFARGNV